MSTPSWRAITLCHPLGGPGAKLPAALLRETPRRNARYGIVTMCVGSGMCAAPHLRGNSLMRNQTMAGREALKRIRPRTRRSRGELLAILGFMMVGIVGAGVLAYGRYRSLQSREQNWYSAIAVVEDVRTKVAEQVNGRAGGEMRYDVEVLARFPVGGTPQERWIWVEQTPIPLDYAEFESRRWKGKSYFVRWSPSNPDQIIIDID